jgi:peptidoglycan/LPS O-acetylase OafA/YrhL
MPLTKKPTPQLEHTHTSRRLDIQGLRALAVLSVVIFHADLPLSGGFVGVDVFFVISGFVITRLLKAEFEQAGQFSFLKFYQRRVHRLLPALAFMTVSVAVVGPLLVPVGTLQTTVNTGIAATLFAANGYLYSSAPGYFAPGAEFNPLLHTWSLSVEEQFYFVFPVVIWAVWRWHARQHTSNSAVRLCAGLLGAGFLLSFALSAAMSYGSPVLPPIGAPRQFAFYAPLTRAWEFAAGGLLAFSLPSLKKLSETYYSALASIGVIAILGSSILIDGTTQFPGLVALFPAIGTVLLIWGGSSRDCWTTRFLSSSPLVWIGDRSYGWYLWHWPFVVFSKAIFPGSHLAVFIASILALSPTMLSYRWIEMRFRQSQDARPSQTLFLFGLCIGAPILAFWAMSIAGNALLDTTNGKPIKQAIALHADTVHGCEGLEPLRPDYTGNCLWRTPNSKGLILLLGDSNAGHLTEAVVAASNRQGFDALVTTVPACPFIDRMSFSNGVPNVRCKKFVDGSTAAIQVLKPKLVIVASASDGYIEAPSATIQSKTAPPDTQTPEEKAAIWTAGLNDLLLKINKVSPALLVHPPPRFHTWALTSCASFFVWQDPQRCAADIPRHEVEKWRDKTVVAEKSAVARQSSTSTLDLNQVLCTEDLCAVKKEGVWMYRDGAHISVPGSVQLMPIFERAIVETTRR